MSSLKPHHKLDYKHGWEEPSKRQLLIHDLPTMFLQPIVFYPLLVVLLICGMYTLERLGVFS
ncbi:MAG: hypothetical protein AAF743_14705 [Planctomycetota bacterium]